MNQDTKFCSDCGKQILQKAELCVGCGTRQFTPDDIPNRVVASVLALLLGSIGAHKFYLGKPGLGIIYILFCWTFLPTVVAFFEGLFYLSTSNYAWANKYRNSENK